MDGLEAVRLLGVTLQRLSFSPHRRMRRRTVAVEAIAIREAMGDTTGAARTREVFEQIGSFQFRAGTHANTGRLRSYPGNDDT
jgi:hypothetical protein